MRPILLGLCVLTAACSGQDWDSPTSPTNAISALSRARAKGDAQFPFVGSFTMRSSGVVTPPTLHITGTAEGTATALGRFTAAVTNVVNIATTQSTGTLTFTAANGDQLITATTGSEDAFVPPNVSHVTLAATIVGGTGRFAAAAGTFSVRLVAIIDFATGTSAGTGSFEGHIDLKQ